MNRWMLQYDRFEPREEGLREALCTLGNGYFCTRGAAAEAAADGTHYPGCYLAGGYNRLTTDIAGRSVENEDLVNLPNWLDLRFRIGEGAWFCAEAVEILAFRQQLDLATGVLWRSLRFRDAEGRESELGERRLVSMDDRHLAALEWTLTPYNWSGRVTVASGLDAGVTNANVARYRDLAGRHLETLETSQPGVDTVFLRVRTRQSGLVICQTARTRVFAGGRAVTCERLLDRRPDYVGQVFAVDLAPRQELRLEKRLALYTSRDEAISEPGLAACRAARQELDFERLLARHSLCWRHLWQRFDFAIAGDDGLDRLSMILRLHVFHLLQTASLHTIELDVGVPARGWHGEAYRGHIFWDELFIFPLLNLRTPEITRTLLKYRYRRLPEARAAALRAGCRGAMFPWQSGSSGREESQQLHLNPRSGNWLADHSRLQRHVNAAIAWNVWQYFQGTGDMEFLSFCGAEIILEIARFWASLAQWNAVRERFEILGVMGPDEYHDSYPDADRPGLDNNAYTNLMAVWTLSCALELLDTLPGDRHRELCESLEIEAAELAHWEQVSRRMRLVFHDDGILSQFEGYEGLEELDWESYRQRHGQVMRLDRILEAEQDSPNRYKCSKQADVLMLFYLFSTEELGGLFARLGYPFDCETIPRNIAYYLERTAHGSTLSQVVHSWVLARSRREESWQLFCEALRADIDDTQGGTTPEGIHLGAMAGTVDLLQRGYTGIETRGGMLHLNPCLPRELTRLKMRLRYRGQSLELDISARQLVISCRQCELEPIRCVYDGRCFLLKGGETLTLELH